MIVKHSYQIFLCGLVLLVSININAQSLSENIEKCAKIVTDIERLKCFDSISETVQAIPQPLTNELKAVEPITKLEVNQPKQVKPSSNMDDSIGGSKFAKKEVKEGPITEGRVVDCQKAADDKFTFTFSSGQIWKQSNSKSYRFKTCEFDVTIDKDFFGYYLKIKDKSIGPKGKIRVNRLQ